MSDSVGRRAMERGRRHGAGGGAGVEYGSTELQRGFVRTHDRGTTRQRRRQR